MNIRSIPICLLALSAGLAFAQDPFYDRPALFSYRPDDSKSLHNIARFGPVGIGIDLLQPAYRMRVSHVDPGSPSEGKLNAGQFHLHHSPQNPPHHGRTTGRALETLPASRATLGQRGRQQVPLARRRPG